LRLNAAASDGAGLGRDLKWVPWPTVLKQIWHPASHVAKNNIQASLVNGGTLETQKQ